MCSLTIVFSYCRWDTHTHTAYADPQKFGTEDAMRIGRLHTVTGGWEDAMIGFMNRSYVLSLFLLWLLLSSLSLLLFFYREHIL